MEKFRVYPNKRTGFYHGEFWQAGKRHRIKLAPDEEIYSWHDFGTRRNCKMWFVMVVYKSLYYRELK